MSPTQDESTSNSDHAPAGSPPDRRWYASEDWWAVWIGAVVLAGCTAALYTNLPEAEKQPSMIEQSAQESLKLTTPLQAWLAKPKSWTNNPLEAFYLAGKNDTLPGIAGVFVLSLFLFGIACRSLGTRIRDFIPAYCFIYLLGLFSYLLASQSVI